MRVAIHQPNFVPHLGFFYKMSQSDIFVLLTQVQFEKNGYQNRYYLHRQSKWVTKPVCSGAESIYQKEYIGGQNLAALNIQFILWAKDVLNIDTEISMDVPSNNSGTQRLIDNLNFYGATKYITNPSAKDKYLDENLIRKAGIDIEYSDCPNAKLNILECFEEFGIEGTRKQLWKPRNISVEKN